jgi:hypothetical protein
MSPAVMTFEVLRFEAVPAAAGVAVLELDGRFATGTVAPDRPRVLVERPDGATELPAVEVLRDPWSATFAVPLDALADPDTTFALVPGRGPLIALPSPSIAGADDDRFVRLARTVNDLRHRLTEASSAAGVAEQRRADAVARRDRTVAELHDARRRIAELEARAERAEQSAQAADASASEADEGARRADAELAQARAQIAALTDRAEAAERAAAEEAEARGSAERDAVEVGDLLGALRVRIEDLEDERDHLAAAAEAARADVPADEDEDAEDDEDIFGATLVIDRPQRPAAGALRWDADPEPASESTQTLELTTDELDATPPEDEPAERVRVAGPRRARAVAPRPARAAAIDLPHGLTPARIVVGGALALLFVLLLLIFLTV